MPNQEQEHLNHYCIGDLLDLEPVRIVLESADAVAPATHLADQELDQGGLAGARAGHEGHGGGMGSGFSQLLSSGFGPQDPV